MLGIGMDGESETIEVVDDTVSEEEMRRDLLPVFDHVHELLHGWVFGLDGELGGGKSGIEGGDVCDGGKTTYESFAG